MLGVGVLCSGDRQSAKKPGTTSEDYVTPNATTQCQQPEYDVIQLDHFNDQRGRRRASDADAAAAEYIDTIADT